jgi:anion-transporting  ArsA/GET3 family ATPase
MANNQSRIDQFLLSSQIMIENSLSDGIIKTALANYGYTEEKLKTGKQLYEEAVALQNAQKKEYGDQIAATAELNNTWEMAHQQYIRTLKIARVAFNDNIKADKTTMLFGRRKQSLSGWLEQARAFYKNLLGDTDFLAALSEFGYTEEKLRQESTLIDQVISKHLAQKKEIGEAQEATETRDKALDKLANWISDLRAVAKVALEDNPQQLEKLGILARKK